MRSLIVYYSHTGNNEKLAYVLKERLDCDIYKISELKERKTISILFNFLFKRNTKLTDCNANLKEYDSIILVAPVWAGRIATPMRAFIEGEKNNIRNYSFISLCNGETGQKDKIAGELYSLIKHDPKNVTELCINSLLPEEKRNKIKHTFYFRMRKEDFEQFDELLESFVEGIKS